MEQPEEKGSLVCH